jgi:hypothetical protein
MADPKMRWDKDQCRWRAMYKGKRFTVKAADLGGTGRDDTVVASNRWFEQQKAERDALLRQQTLRPNEDDYQSELEGLQTTLRKLAGMMKNPAMKETIEPVYHLTGEKIVKLQKLYSQESLPPLDDSLRNPLHISAKQIEEDAEKEVIESIYQDMLTDYMSYKRLNGWLKQNQFVDHKDYDGLFPGAAYCILTGNYVCDPDRVNWELVADTTEEVIDNLNHNDNRDRLLLNTNGRGLWYEYFNNGSHKENDSISQQFERFIAQFKKDKPDFPRFTFSMLRRTASTAISNHKIFGHLDSLWLGHAPRTTAGRHYTVPDADRLDDCIVWLERKLFDDPIVKNDDDEANQPV